MASGAAKVLAGPAGYAVPIIVAGIALYVLYRIIKKPVADAANAVYSGAQNFDENIGASGFDAWVSSWFQPSSPPVN